MSITCEWLPACAHVTTSKTPITGLQVDAAGEEEAAGGEHFSSWAVPGEVGAVSVGLTLLMASLEVEVYNNIITKEDKIEWQLKGGSKLVQFSNRSCEKTVHSVYTLTAVCI